VAQGIIPLGRIDDTPLRLGALGTGSGAHRRCAKKHADPWLRHVTACHAITINDTPETQPDSRLRPHLLSEARTANIPIAELTTDDVSSP
jgi:hypothetical protein